MDTQKMIENGFERGVIIASTEEKNCPFVIEVAGKQDNYYLDRNTSQFLRCLLVRSLSRSTARRAASAWWRSLG